MSELIQGCHDGNGLDGNGTRIDREMHSPSKKTVHSRKAGAMNWRIGTNSCTTMVVLPSMVKASERHRGHVIIACPRTTRLDPDKKSRFWKLSLGH